MGENLSIKELAEKIKNIVWYKRKIIWDKTKLDGTPRKLLDVKKLNKLGWKYKIDLEDGLRMTYERCKAIIFSTTHSVISIDKK